MRHVNRLACLSLALCTLTTLSPAAEPTVSQIAAGIQDQHYRLLHLDGGVVIKFKLHVEQTKSQEVFLFDDGAEGILSIKWPVLYVSVTGKNSTNGQRVEREGQYNFETQLGAGRDGLFAQLTPYRHQTSASLVFQLICMYYDESDQKYTPDKPYRSTRWLPSCLEGRTYSLNGRENVGGRHCIVLASSDGSDAMWIDPTHDFALTKRVIRDKKSGLIKERATNSEFYRVAEGVWFPLKQVYEFYNYSFKHTKKTKEFTYRYTLKNEIVSAPSRKFEVTLPDQTTVDDQLHGIMYVKAKKLDHAFAPSLKQAALDIMSSPPSQEPPFPWRPVVSVTILSVLLSTMSALIGRRSGSWAHQAESDGSTNATR